MTGLTRATPSSSTRVSVPRPSSATETEPSAWSTTRIRVVRPFDGLVDRVGEHLQDESQRAGRTRTRLRCAGSRRDGRGRPGCSSCALLPQPHLARPQRDSNAMIAAEAASWPAAIDDTTEDIGIG